MLDTVEFTLGSALANAGTVTVSYPDGRSKGNYSGFGINHVLVAGQNKYTAPKDFTLTFNANASDITLTSGISTTLPAGTKCYLGIERRGEDDFAPVKPASAVKMVTAGLYALDLGSPDVADPNGYVESQDLTSAGVFSVDATAAAAIAAAALDGEADVPRNVVAAWTGTAVLTVTGTDEYGEVLVEKSGSGTSLTGKKAFKTVTGISSSANITSLTVGTGDVLGLPVFIPAAANVVAEMKDGATLPRKPERVFVPWSIPSTQLDANTSRYVISPVNGSIVGAGAVVDTILASAGGTVTIEYGNVAVSGLSLAIASAASVGTIVGDTASALMAVTANGAIEIANASFGAGELSGYVEIQTADSERLSGTLVVGSAVAATATTGDVRGTYDPADACDGSAGYVLLVSLSDPSAKGQAQYAG